MKLALIGNMRLQGNGSTEGKLPQMLAGCTAVPLAIRFKACVHVSTHVCTSAYILTARQARSAALTWLAPASPTLQARMAARFLTSTSAALPQRPRKQRDRWELPTSWIPDRTGS